MVDHPAILQAGVHRPLHLGLRRHALAALRNPVDAVRHVRDELKVAPVALDVRYPQGDARPVVCCLVGLLRVGVLVVRHVVQQDARLEPSVAAVEREREPSRGTGVAERLEPRDCVKPWVQRVRLFDRFAVGGGGKVEN